MKNSTRVVIIGGGFGGLYAARSLKRSPVRVTLIDRRNFHLFQPLLYQVATGALSPANIAAPLRSILKRQRNTQVLMADVVDIDVNRRRVVLPDSEVEYDYLIIATGVRHNYFGRDEWEKFAPGLKTIEDATEIRSRVLSAFEAAEIETDQDKVRALLTFAVVGAGPTGVEMAGALAEVAKHTLKHDFRSINPANAEIILVEGADRVLPHYPEDLSAKAKAALERMGVTVKTGAMVTEIRPEEMRLRVGDSQETVFTRNIFWAAGVLASPLGRILAERTGAAVDKVGHVAVEPDMSLKGHPNVFVIGDLALFTHQDGQPLPGIAPVAMQQGRYVARLIEKRMTGESLPPFRFRDYGKMATIGRAAAVADFGWLRLNGYVAWLTWLFIHLMYIVEFNNRLLVLTQWAWNYFTRNRSARLITNPGELEEGRPETRRSVSTGTWPAAGGPGA